MIHGLMGAQDECCLFAEVLKRFHQHKPHLYIDILPTATVKVRSLKLSPHISLGDLSLILLSKFISVESKVGVETVYLY